jgi:hypothetical protein
MQIHHTSQSELVSLLLPSRLRALTGDRAADIERVSHRVVPDQLQLCAQWLLAAVLDSP